ncbi:MAG: hypothetical protein JWO15_3585 [Sphingomonadales bacterium]|nr:hypothetical protein [Sphingomonadales bacterium]
MLYLLCACVFLLYVLFFPGALSWTTRDNKRLYQVAVTSLPTFLKGTDASWQKWIFYIGGNPSFKIPSDAEPNFEFIQYNMIRLTILGMTISRIGYTVDYAAVEAAQKSKEDIEPEC